MRIQLKPEIREKIKLRCGTGMGWAEIDHWHYPMKMLEIEYFEVRVFKDNEYEVLNPLHMRGSRLPKKHTEPYKNKLDLDEKLFEWEE